jgi:hypothetical protein
MNNELSEALENCLQAIKKGQSLEAALARYPKLAPELRPLLKTSILARSSRQLVILETVKRRGRMRLLQRAAEMRSAMEITPRRRIPTFSRVAITLGLVGMLVLTSTGFVSASSGALPGDQLYPVKRTWEGVRLFFVFSPQEHDILTSEFDQERLNEIDELLVKGQAAPITFTGLVTRQVDGQWMVSGIPVSVSNSSNSSLVTEGAPVTITGITRGDGVVEAQQIQLIKPGAPLPPFEPSENGEPNSREEQDNGAVLPTPHIVATANPSGSGSENSTQAHKSYQFTGVVQSIKKDVWVINGQSVNTNQAAMTGNIKIGSVVKFNGYFNPDGTFVVTSLEDNTNDNKIQHRNDSSGSSSGSGTNGNEQPGGGEGGDSGDDSGH